MTRGLIRRVRWARVGFVSVIAFSACALDAQRGAERSPETMQPGWELTAALVHVPPLRWEALHSGPGTVDWPVTAIPSELAERFSRHVELGEEVTLELIPRTYPEAYQRWDPESASVQLPELARLQVTLRRKGELLEIDLRVQPSELSRYVDHHCLPEGTRQVEFLEPWAPAHVTALLTPQQSLLLPGPLPGQAIAVGASRR